MAPKEQQREAAIDLIAAHILETGLSQASLRQLARAAQISDRMLLYYFKDKEEVVTLAMAKIAGSLAGDLAKAIPDGEKHPVSEMVAIAATLTQSDQVRPLMQLWLEATAAAVRKEAPFVDITKQIAGGFLNWIESHLDEPDSEVRKSKAAMVLAMVDGLALLEACTDKETALIAANSMRTALK